MISNLVRGTMLWIVCMFCMHVHAQYMPVGLHLQGEVNTASSEHYTLKGSNNERVAAGDLKENIRARFNLGYMMPVSRKVTIGLSASYSFNNEHLSGLSDDDVYMSDNHHNIRAGANVMYFTTLWKKPLIVFGNMSIDASQWGVQRVTFMGAATLMLITTPEHQLGIGPLVMLNTTTRVPFLFIATYRRVFSPKWALNLNYPMYGMQFTPSPKHALAGGFTFDTDYYWVQPNNIMLPTTTFFRRSLFCTGINYDVHVTPNLTITAQTGWEYTMAGGLYTANGHHQLYELNHTNGPYAHIRFSFRPETKMTRKIKQMQAAKRQQLQP